MRDKNGIKHMEGLNTTKQMARLLNIEEPYKMEQEYFIEDC